MPRLRLIVLVFALTFPSLAHAQVRRDTTRSPMRGEMGTMMQQQMDMVAEMMSSMLRSTMDFLAEPENAQRLATFTKNYFDALMSKGFTRDEALRIVIGHGIPMPAGK